MTTAEGAWGSCPECDAAIAESMAFCKGCGFPLKPVQTASVSAPPPTTAPVRPTTRSIGRKRRRGGKGRPILEPGEEPPAAMAFAFFGLLVPVLAVVALALSRRGSGAYKLAWAGIALWIASSLFILSRMRG